MAENIGSQLAKALQNGNINGSISGANRHQWQ